MCSGTSQEPLTELKTLNLVIKSPLGVFYEIVASYRPVVSVFRALPALPPANRGNGKLYKLLVDEESGQPKKAGFIIRRADYADALDLIAEDPQSFYSRSDISRDIADSVSLLQ